MQPSTAQANVDLLSALAECKALSPHLVDELSARLRRLEQLETQFASTLERAKLAALKQLAYGASHEINNPLANISTRAQALLAEESHPERRKKLATIVAQAFRAHEMISDLMLFAKPPALELVACGVAALVEQVAEESRGWASEQQTEISCAVDPPEIVLSADPTHLAVALKALVRNALEALGSGGRIEITATEDDGWIAISVADDGPGIPPAVREHLFDPFYSGREAGRGLGFGLAKCWRIAELHGGSLAVESEPGQGAIFCLLLPGNAEQRELALQVSAV